MLNPEQRAMVASEVEQREYVELCLGPNGGGMSYVCLKSDPHNFMWKPDFKGKDWQRLQALALVEWLADVLNPSRHMRLPYQLRLREHIGLRRDLWEFTAAVANKDITALEWLANGFMEAQ